MNDVQVRHVRFYEPEIIRLRGEILLAQASGNAAKAEAAFRQAMTCERAILPRHRIARRD